MLTRQGTCYSWGYNEFGQLGQGDYKERATPERIDGLDNKRVTSIAVGHDFVIALGLTLPQREYEKLAKKGAGIINDKASLKGKHNTSIAKISQRSTSKTTKSNAGGRAKSNISKGYLH